MSAMPFITLPDHNIRINLFTVSRILTDSEHSSATIHFANGDTQVINNAEITSRILQYWDSVSEDVTSPTEPAPPVEDTGRDFDLGDPTETFDDAAEAYREDAGE